MNIGDRVYHKVHGNGGVFYIYESKRIYTIKFDNGVVAAVWNTELVKI